VIAPEELSRRVRALELRARKNVSHLGEGAYKSAFKGHGVEFQEIREYTPGDDIRTIDWNVTARHGRTYVKRFAEEREQTILLLVDGSASIRFGSKHDVISEIAATLAYAAAECEDKTGLILFGNEVEEYVPPGGGITHALRIIRDVCNFSPVHPGTDLVRALQFLDRIATRRAFVFLISDFLAPDASAQLRVSARRHNLVALRVSDALEAQLPDCGLVELVEPESGSRIVLDTSDPAVRLDFAKRAGRHQRLIIDGLHAAGVDDFQVTAGQDYFPALLKFLKAHARRN
jgi:uncharacterized protein (DUF58 family)